MIHNKIINQFQHFSFHLVDPSPWPILTSFSLLNLTVGAVSYMHGYPNGGYILTSGLLLTVFGMILWFRDIVIEGTAISFFTIKSILSNHIYYTSKAISPEEIEQALLKFTSENKEYLNKDQFSYYLAGLLEGDGHLSLPALGNTTLNRILNPRIVFTSHINNLGLYAYIQYELGGIGRFQIYGKSQSTIR